LKRRFARESTAARRSRDSSQSHTQQFRRVRSVRLAARVIAVASRGVGEWVTMWTVARPLCGHSHFLLDQQANWARQRSLKRDSRAVAPERSAKVLCRIAMASAMEPPDSTRCRMPTSYAHSADRLGPPRPPPTDAQREGLAGHPETNASEPTGDRRPSRSHPGSFRAPSAPTVDRDSAAASRAECPANCSRDRTSGRRWVLALVWAATGSAETRMSYCTSRKPAARPYCLPQTTRRNEYTLS